MSSQHLPRDILLSLFVHFKEGNNRDIIVWYIRGRNATDDLGEVKVEAQNI